MTVAAKTALAEPPVMQPLGRARSAAFYSLLVGAVRNVLGLEFLLNGLNWWVKLIDPYPSISDFLHRDPPPDVVGAMIKTGILFHVVKGLELTAGVALLANRFVPLALVAVLPVTVNVFLVDVFLVGSLRGRLMGSGALMMSGFLMLAHFRYYAPMLDFRTTSDRADDMRLSPVAQFAWLNPQKYRLGRTLMLFFGLASLAIGLVMVGWVFVFIWRHFAHG